MSEESYELNVKRGVTGPSTATCLLAAYDRITLRGGVRPDTYRQYDNLFRHHTQVANEAPNDAPTFIPADILRDFRQLRERFYKELGVIGTKNIVNIRANTKDELYGALRDLSQGGFRPAVYLDIDGSHALGAVPLDDEYYDLKSNWSPYKNNRPVSVSEIFKHLEQSPRIHIREHGRKTYTEPNIVALPPEPRR